MAEALKQAGIDTTQVHKQEYSDGKTPAERRFEEVQRKRVSIM
jgi:hypothetical protein